MDTKLRLVPDNFVEDTTNEPNVQYVNGLYRALELIDEYKNQLSEWQKRGGAINLLNKLKTEIEKEMNK
jgi:hypothetical protein